MSKINKKKVVQIGIMVRDLKKSVVAYEKFLGIKADYVGITGPYEITKSDMRGEPCCGRCHQALFNLENIQIELVSPYGDEPSVWRECLEKDGEGLHHLAFLTEDMEGSIEELKAGGAEYIQHGFWPAKPRFGEYTYMDKRDDLKMIVEILLVPFADT